MSNRYAPLPSSNVDENNDQQYESDDEDEHIAETRPLNKSSSPAQSQAPVAEAYQSENAEYDYPPPGNPPGPSATAHPNDYGNSNGLIPSFEVDTSTTAQRRGWFRRAAAAILPSHYVQRLGLIPRVPTGAIGGGTNNDGVFANVTAKPSLPVRVGEGDEAYLVPEDSRPEAPPSYVSAQADAVPSYFETTVHAPPVINAPGETIIDNLPTGSLFSFLWNMLVSISFQFIGFLLTYLLHTTHAARLGSRAGLGVVLIQYGFALRGKPEGDGSNSDAGLWGDWVAPAPDSHIRNTTAATPTVPEEMNTFAAEATRQWLSFFLMTVGWFILTISVLGFWRVKRWEQGILASQRENTTAVHASASASSRFERLLGLRNALALRQGLGFRSWESMFHDRSADRGSGEIQDEELPMIPLDPEDPARNQLIQQVLADEQRLRDDLRAAGLI